MKTLLKSTFNIVAAVVVLFALIAIIVAKNTSALMVSEAERTVRSVVKNTTGRIDRLMTSVESAVANQKWVIGEHLDDPDYMYRITRELVENNAYIVGSTVAFRPDFFKSKGRLYSPYSCRSGNGRIESFTLPYEYPEYEWYKVARESGKARWSEPYFDEGGGQVDMSTFSMPIYDARTNFLAIFTADISLEQLKQHVASICPFPNSYAVMRSAQGKALVDPPAGRGAGEGKTITIRDTADNGWTVEVVCPVEEILRGAQQLVIRIIIFSALGLVMIFIVAWIYSSRLQRSVALRERMAGELDPESVLARRDGGQVERGLALVVVVEEDLGLLGGGDDLEARGQAHELHGQRLAVAGRQTQLARLLAVSSEAEGHGRDTLGDLSKLHRRHAALDAVDHDGGAGRLGRDFDRARGRHEPFLADERLAAVELDGNRLVLVARLAETDRIRVLRRQVRDQPRRPPDGNAVDLDVASGRLGLQQKQSLHLVQDLVLLDVRSLVGVEEPVARDISRQPALEVMAARLEVEQGHGRRAAVLPVDNDRRSGRLARDAHARQRRIGRPRAQRAAQGTKHKAHCTRHTAHLHRLPPLMRFSTSISLADASRLRSSVRSGTISMRTVSSRCADSHSPRLIARLARKRWSR